MAQLALLGGNPVRTQVFPAYKVIGEDDLAAVTKVMQSGILSRFLGVWHPDFFGGPEVQAFEQEWAAAFGASHAISVNSNTSGLFCAIGAAGVGPGDEVIVSPYTMSASAVAPLIFNAVPVFADIDPVNYCLSAQTIAAKITPRTKAIVVVHIFGNVAEMGPIMELAAQHNLIVIEDCAQAPFATLHGKSVGTLGHMGVFSLNYHKHIHTGEGGVVTTNDARLAERVQLIRNHAEAVIEAKTTATGAALDLVNMIGFNMRLGEVEAAIGRRQLAKGPALIDQRRSNVAYLEQKLAGLPGVALPQVADGVKHVYYVHALSYDESVTGVSRATWVAALKAELPPTELREGEGVLIGQGYVRPLYRQPLYQNKVAYGDGRTGCPFACPHYKGVLDYSPESYPHVEQAHYHRVVTHELMRPPMIQTDLDAVADAFYKVSDNLAALRDWEKAQQP